MRSGKIGRAWIILGCLAAVATPALAQDSSPGSNALFRAVGGDSGGIVVERDVKAWAKAIDRDGAFVIDDFPLGDGRLVSLEMERFQIASERTRFVVGGANGDIPIEFDAESVVFLRGTVRGRAGSHVFLSVAPGSTVGRVEMGPGYETYAISTSDTLGEAGTGERLVVRETRGGNAGMSLPLACDIGESGEIPTNISDAPLDPVRGLKQVELALDSDNELFLLRGTEQSTITYMLQVYGTTSDIMMRDLRVRMDIVYLRIWPGPDPWGPKAGFPNLPGVHYDVAQLLSGTRDVGSGGLATLCGSLSWVGFARGFFTDPTYSNVFNQDIIIAAHELGHNLGANHTHYYGLDACNDTNTQPRRGSIISYCYYFSGGYSVTDLRYHTFIANKIAECMGRQSKYVPDCNQNGIEDALDISTGFSGDANNNGIPDECEDCNGNGTLDDQDIATGTSKDLNGNGVPDECEPDCNQNGVPDEMDIRTGTSLDDYGNGIPDECEADCNNNGISDYTDIQLDMTLDIDRNAVLDSCQDCDNDGTPDLIALNGANNLWAISSGDAIIREYHAVTGVLMRESQAGHLSDPTDLLITADGRILVSSSGDDRIVEFDRTGAYVADLVASGSAGLDEPGGMLIAPDGTLLVASQATNEVLRYDLATGTSLGAFVQAGSGGLTRPYGLAIAPNNRLLVTSQTNEVMEYDATTGSFVRILVAAAFNGDLSTPRDLIITPDSLRVVVASMDNSRLLQYAASTGQSLGRFNLGDFKGLLQGTWGLAIGPNGNIYASASERGEAVKPLQFHLTDPRILAYNGHTGLLLRTYVQRNDAELHLPKGLAFMPGDDYDCNLNQIPDSCDISTGRSLDTNANGVPDECENACYADCDQTTSIGGLDIMDFVCFQTRFVTQDPYACDCDTSTGNGICDIFDFLCFQNAFVAGCP